ncbi:MAG: hypothetical protein EHM70_01195 [Chloroflexota bacterium]|nr:MAG: hypothetical protein EHM70_01195 [Chloroflexota bacterium]
MYYTGSFGSHPEARQPAVLSQKFGRSQKISLKKLLLKRSQIDFATLADELCISPVMLQNELPRLKMLLAEYELVFRIKNNMASIEGPEFNK